MSNTKASNTNEGFVPPGRAIAGVFALAGFIVAVAAGLDTGNSAAAILARALLAMVVCFAVGVFAGMLCEHVLAKDAEMFAASKPVPDSSVTAEQMVEEMRKRDEVKGGGAAEGG